MLTIAVLNPKGGSGKTTAATCLARALEKGGDRVLLVDADPQGSARDWHAVEEANPTPCVAMDRPGGLRSLRDMGGYDWAIIDGAGRYERIIADAIKLADLVLIPVQPSPYDIWAINELVELVQQRQTIANGQPIMGAIITRAVPNTVLDREVLEALKEMQLEVMDTRIHQRQIYPRSANTGQTPLETEPSGKAAQEIRAAAKEIREIFNPSDYESTPDMTT